MVDNEILFSRGSIVVERSAYPKPDVLEMLSSTVWGTPGGTLFRHLDTRDTLPQMYDPVFITLRKLGVVNGILSFSRRKMNLDDIDSAAYYIKHLCFAENWRPLSNKHKKNSDKDMSALKSTGLMRNLMQNIFKNQACIGEATNRELPAFFYAYVEPGNVRSLQMSTSFGFIPVRELSTIAFSRFNPRKSEKVSRAESSEKANIISNVQHFYSDHSLFFDSYIYQHNNYFVLRHEGKIVAGVQAGIFHWQVAELPGISGKIILNWMPHIPWISRLFNPADWRFAAFEAFFYKEGHENALPILFESVLATLQVHAALIWMDKRSRWHSTLQTKMNLGMLNKIKSDVPVNLMTLPVNISSNAIEIIKNQPAYVSAFDLS